MAAAAPAAAERQRQQWRRAAHPLQHAVFACQPRGQAVPKSELLSRQVGTCHLFVPHPGDRHRPAPHRRPGVGPAAVGPAAVHLLGDSGVSGRAGQGQSGRPPATQTVVPQPGCLPRLHMPVASGSGSPCLPTHRCSTVCSKQGLSGCGRGHSRNVWRPPCWVEKKTLRSITAEGFEAAQSLLSSNLTWRHAGLCCACTRYGALCAGAGAAPPTCAGDIALLDGHGRLQLHGAADGVRALRPDQGPLGRRVGRPTVVQAVGAEQGGRAGRRRVSGAGEQENAKAGRPARPPDATIHCTQRTSTANWSKTGGRVARKGSRARRQAPAPGPGRRPRPPAAGRAQAAEMGSW